MKSEKKSIINSIIGTTLAAIMLVASVVAPSSKDWDDVSGGHWNFGFASTAMAADLPHQNVMTKELSDVPASAWYIDNHADMFMAGIIDGTKTNADTTSARFDPNGATTYGSFLKMLTGVKGYVAG